MVHSVSSRSGNIAGDVPGDVLRDVSGRIGDVADGGAGGGRRVAVATGASTGIGRATALRLDADGWTVLAGVRLEADGEALARAASGRLRPLALDVADAASVEAARAAAAAACGPGGLAALVNDAGVNLTGPAEHADEAAVRALQEVNLPGPFRTARAMLPLLRRHAAVTGRTARIVDVGSIGSRVGIPSEAFYHASKFALLGYDEALAHEVRAQRVRVTTVMPGGVRTPFISKTTEGLRAAAAALPPEGAGLYAAGMERTARLAGAAERLGTRPERVAAAIARALDARSPPARVLVGADARLMETLRRLLPARAFHALIRRAFVG